MANEVGKEILRAFIGVRADSSRVESDIAAAKSKAQKAASGGPGGGNVFLDGLIGNSVASSQKTVANGRNAANGIMSGIVQNIAGELQGDSGSMVQTALLGGGVGAVIRQAGGSIFRSVATGLAGSLGAASGAAVGAVAAPLFGFVSGEAQKSSISKAVGKYLEGVGGRFEDLEKSDAEMREIEKKLAEIDQTWTGPRANKLDAMRGFYENLKTNIVATFSFDGSNTYAGLLERRKQVLLQREATQSIIDKERNYMVTRGAGMEVTAQFQSIAFNIEAFTRANTLLGRR